MRILVVNVGSTGIKLRVIDDDDAVAGSVDLPSPPDLGGGVLSSALAELPPFDAVGHRVVHGGSEFRSPTLLDEGVMAKLRGLTGLAPLHQPLALDAIDIVTKAVPHLAAVACFDTAFHATLPAEAYTYAIPSRWRELGARRYGFHGLSHSWASKRAAEMCALPPPHARIVTCHLGGGASLAAVADGRCVDTTMGFTPLEGLVMTTRSGSVDPGLVLWLQTQHGFSAGQVADNLETSSGLVGLCGSADMRVVAARAVGGEPSAALAFGVYIHRLRAGIAAMTAALGGLDVLVFTGGIGEGSSSVRASACAGLGFLGVELDDDANTAGGGDRLISPPEPGAHVLVVKAREDLEIAAGVRAALARSPL